MLPAYFYQVIFFHERKQSWALKKKNCPVSFSLQKTLIYLCAFSIDLAATAFLEERKKLQRRTHKRKKMNECKQPFPQIKQKWKLLD